MSTAATLMPSPSGSEDIDDEHREILQLIADFDALLRRGGTKDQIVDLFAVVLFNIRSHFETEEHLMLEHAYADYDAHKAEHDDLLRELNEIMTDCEFGAYADRHLALAQRVSDWFSAHTEKTDAPMIAFEHDHMATAGPASQS